MSIFVTYANKLKYIQNSIQKNEDKFLEQMEKEDASIKQYHHDAILCRLAETDKLHKEIQSIFSNLNTVKCVVVKDEIDDVDIQFIKKVMTQIQNDIPTIKKQTKERLQELEKEELELQKEAEIYKQKISEWGKPLKVENTCLYKKRRTTQNWNSVPKEVQDYLTLINNSGHTNGWSMEDHQLYLKKRKQYRENKNLAKKLHELLPDISEEEILEHDSWYKNYLEVKNKQREAIQKWRSNKSQSCILQQKKPKDVRRCVSSYSQSNLSPYEKEDVKEKISVWKAQKMEREIRQKEIELEIAEKIKQKEVKKLQENKEIQELIKKWKQQKEEKVKMEKAREDARMLKEKQYRSAQAKKLIKEFQRHDQRFTEKKVELKKPKAEHLCNVQPLKTGIRDPQRLLKPTKQWLHRTAHGQKPITGFELQCIPKLGIPEWRKEVI